MLFGSFSSSSWPAVFVAGTVAYVEAPLVVEPSDGRMIHERRPGDELDGETRRKREAGIVNGAGPEATKRVR